MSDIWSREVVLRTCDQLIDEMPQGACLMFCRSLDDRYLVIPVSSEDAAPILDKYFAGNPH